MFTPLSRASTGHGEPKNRFNLLTDHRVFVGKLTAYAPYGNQEEHPLHDAHTQLQARLQALREVRSRLTFIPSRNQAPLYRRRISSDSDEVEMTEASASASASPLNRSASMDIVTRMAVAGDANADTWMEEGGIAAMDGLEALFLRFLTPNELISVSGVCQSWYALARRNELWEPLLVTPLERYPLRPFLGFNATGLPAMQVYIVYRKLQWQLQFFDPKDSAPTHNQENNRDHDEDDARDDATSSVRGRERDFKSVHLTWNLRPKPRDPPEQADVRLQETHALANALLNRRRHRLLRLHDNNNTNNPLNDGQDQDNEDDGEPDAPAPFEFLLLDTPPPPATTPVIDSIRRFRLDVWLMVRKRMSTAIFRCFARQLLAALLVLDRSQLVHTAITATKIYVVERDALQQGANEVVAAVALRQDHQNTSPVCPLFQLYCRRGSNVSAATESLVVDQVEAGREEPQDQQEQEQQQGAGRFALLREYQLRLFQARHRLNVRAPHAAAMVQPVGEQQQNHATRGTVRDATTIRAYLRLLCDVWSHGRGITTAERGMPILSLVFARPERFTSCSFKGLLEYIEFLLSRQDATLEAVGQHAFFHDAADNDNRGCVVCVSSIRPTAFGSADEYRAAAFTWHANYLHNRPLRASRTSRLFKKTSPTLSPTTTLGPAFFRDALRVSRLPYQRLVSVVAPASATSAWVRALATSQRFTLQQLDLSHVNLPLSILLHELQQLPRLTHLRLPREILRDENMEQFVAAISCTRLLPALEFMDEPVRRAMDRLEAAYTLQLGIQAGLLGVAPTLQHTFSAPF